MDPPRLTSSSAPPRAAKQGTAHEHKDPDVFRKLFVPVVCWAQIILRTANGSDDVISIDSLVRLEGTSPPATNQARRRCQRYNLEAKKMRHFLGGVGVGDGNADHEMADADDRVGASLRHERAATNSPMFWQRTPSLTAMSKSRNWRAQC